MYKQKDIAMLSEFNEEINRFEMYIEDYLYPSAEFSLIIKEFEKLIEYKFRKKAIPIYIGYAEDNGRCAAYYGLDPTMVNLYEFTKFANICKKFILKKNKELAE